MRSHYAGMTAEICIKSLIHQYTIAVLSFRVLENDGEHIPPGRKRILSIEGLKELRRDIDAEIEELNAPLNDNKYIGKKIMEFAAKEQKNVYAGEGLSLSRKTVWRYKQQAGLLPGTADIKSKKRTEAFKNIRNPLSLCASLEAAFRVVDQEIFFSSDDVSILLNGWEKPKCLTTKEANAFLNENNIGLSHTEDSPKRRVIVMFWITGH